jgi:hypothetical protein
MPEELVASGCSIETVMGLRVGRMDTSAGAAEVVRRWNSHQRLVSIVQWFINENEERGGMLLERMGWEPNGVETAQQFAYRFANDAFAFATGGAR